MYALVNISIIIIRYNFFDLSCYMYSPLPLRAKTYFFKYGLWLLVGVSFLFITQFIHLAANIYDFLGLVILFPVFLHGLVHNFLPAFLPVGLARRLKLEVEYNATIKILAGLITFPLFYYLQTKLIYWLYDGQTALIYLLTLLPFGFFFLGFLSASKKDFPIFPVSPKCWSGKAPEHAPGHLGKNR